MPANPLDILILTGGARKALFEAGSAARRLGHPRIEPGHILIGVVSANSPVVAGVMGAFGTTCSQVRERMEARLQQIAAAAEQSSDTQYSDRAFETLSLAASLARSMRSGGTDVHHLLAALGHQQNDPAVELLRSFGAEPAALEREIRRRLTVSVLLSSWVARLRHRMLLLRSRLLPSWTAYAPLSERGRDA